MALITKAPRGTQDFVPAESAKMRYIEGVLMKIAEKYGFGEMCERRWSMAFWPRPCR